MPNLLDRLRSGWSRHVRALPSRITVLLLVSTLVTSLVVMWVSVRSIHGFLASKIDQKFPAILTATSERLDVWYDGVQLDISTFAHSTIVSANVRALVPPATGRAKGRARRELGEYLAYVLERFPQYSALFLLDRKGNLLYWVGTEAEVPESMRLRLAELTSPAVSDLRMFSGARGQVASSPVSDTRGKHFGSLHAFVPIAGLEERLGSDRLGEGGAVFIVNHAGLYQAGVAPDRIHHEYERELPEGDDPLEPENYRTASGAYVVGTAQRFDRFGWTLAVEESYDDAFAPVFAIVSEVLELSLLTVFVFCGLAFYLARTITRPLLALSDAAQRIADGENEVMIMERTRYDEIGVLTHAFNRMSARLHRNRLALESRNEELQQVNAELEKLSITDGLTKLYNHRYFQEHLRKEIARAERAGDEHALTLILADIDNFKLLNDQWGHAVGDVVLRHVARMMQGVIRETDCLARYGGEEFAIVPGDTDLEGAVGLAEKLRGAVATTPAALDDGQEIAVTVSVGVASFTGDTQSFFVDADRALYEAKHAGKDCVVVSTSD